MVLRLDPLIFHGLWCGIFNSMLNLILATALLPRDAVSILSLDIRSLTRWHCRLCCYWCFVTNRSGVDDTLLLFHLVMMPLMLLLSFSKLLSSLLSLIQPFLPLLHRRRLVLDIALASILIACSCCRRWSCGSCIMSFVQEGFSTRVGCSTKRTLYLFCEAITSFSQTASTRHDSSYSSLCSY